MTGQSRSRKIWAMVEVGAFLFGLFVLGLLYGGYGSHNRWFPMPQIEHRFRELGKMWDRARGKLDTYESETGETQRVRVFQPSAIAPGLTLVVEVNSAHKLSAALIDAAGRRRHRWELDWFKIWPNPNHLSSDWRPKSLPGTDIQGYYLAPNGDLTFNYNYSGLVQVDVCGKVKWRLPYRTHHSVWRDDQGAFWVLGLRYHERHDPTFPNYQPPFHEDMILKVSAEGALLSQTSIPALMRTLGLQGLMYPTSGGKTEVHGDVLHANDLKIFPRGLAPGFLQPGDVMISLRDVNAILILTPDLKRLKRLIIGPFLRQHDPDFVDGDTISIFDNNNIGLARPRASTRVIDYSLTDGATRVRFAGSPSLPFYTSEMGEHQLLPNGGMLLLEQERGRVLEVDRLGRPVWQYTNVIRPGVAASVDGARRVAPSDFDQSRLPELTRACS
ncbi:MAG: arylsulfotransferase family protein [Novosphingobium sp.]